MTEHRLLPLVGIECSDTRCGGCMYLQPGPRMPRCGLFTGQLDEDAGGPQRAEECTDAERSADAIAASEEAIRYLLGRIQEDPNVHYYCGFGTQAFALLCKAESALTGKPLAEVEQQRRKNLTPRHRQQEPDVELLRREIEELRK